MFSQLLPVVILIFVFFIFITIYTPMKRKKKAMSVTEKSSSEIERLREKVLVVTSDSIPNKEIIKVIGIVTGTSRILASTQEESDAAEKEAMASLMKNAVDMGANAVINLKMTTGSFEQQGSKWMVSKVTYNGTAVIVK